MKIICRLAGALLALLAVLSPLVALGAQGGEDIDLGLEHTLAEISMSDMTLNLGEGDLDLGLSADLTAALKSDLSAGALTARLRVDGTCANALTAQAALEDGKINFYAYNDGGSLPYVLSVRLSELASELDSEEMYPGLMDALTYAFAGQGADYSGLIEMFSGPDWMDPWEDIILNYMATSEHATAYTGESFTILDRPVEGDRLVYHLTADSAAALIEYVQDNWPDLFDYAEALMNESGDSLSGVLAPEGDYPGPQYIELKMGGDCVAVSLLSGGEYYSADLRVEFSLLDVTDLRMVVVETMLNYDYESRTYLGIRVSADDNGSEVEMQFTSDMNVEFLDLSFVTNLMLTSSDTRPAEQGGRGSYEMNVTYLTGSTIFEETGDARTNFSYAGTYHEEDGEYDTPDIINDGAVYLDTHYNGERSAALSLIMTARLSQYGGESLPGVDLPELDFYRAADGQLNEYQTALETLSGNIAMILMDSPALVPIIMDLIADGGMYAG